MPSRKRGPEDMDQGARKKSKCTDSPPDDIIEISSDRDLPDVKSASASASASATVIAPAPPTLDAQASKTLQLLHSDFDSLRILVTCRICERLLYEPYVLSCGHTYCYSCLCTWFQGKKKKSCPNCREVIHHVPAPSYVIKEMTSVFVARAELLPDGETHEQHLQWQKEEADIVQGDKNNDDARLGGLFRGCFSSRSQHLPPIFDLEDNVERCPGCNWEIEDGMCTRCGYHVDEDFEIGTEDEISDDLSDELDQDDFDADDADFDEPVLAYQVFRDGPPFIRRVNHFRRPLHDSDEEEEEEAEGSEDEDHSMDGFIVDEAEESDNDETRMSASDIEPSYPVDPPHSIRPTNHHRPRRVITDSDSDDEDGEDGEDGANAGPAAIHIHNSSSELDSDQDRPVRAAAMWRRSAPRPQTIVDSDDDDSEPDLSVRPARFWSTGGPRLQTTRPQTIVDSDDDDLNSDSDGSGSEDVSEPSEGHSGSQTDGSSLRHHSDSNVDSENGSDEEEQTGFSPLQYPAFQELGPDIEDGIDEDSIDEEIDEEEGW